MCKIYNGYHSLIVLILSIQVTTLTFLIWYPLIIMLFVTHVLEKQYWLFQKVNWVNTPKSILSVSLLNSTVLSIIHLYFRCAGLCCYEGRGGLCSVRLSVPLLRLRPRKDLVETLLVKILFLMLHKKCNPSCFFIIPNSSSLGKSFIYWLLWHKTFI